MRIVVEIVLQPVTRFEIKMVGRLVEQQQIGFLQQKLGQREPHLPASGEFVGLLRPVFLGETQPHQDSADFGLDRVAVARAEFVFQPVIAVGDFGVRRAGVIELRHAVREGFQFRLDGAEVVEHGHALVEHRPSRERQAVLRQVSGRRAFRDRERAVVERVQPGQNLHDRGLAGAVRADQPDAVVARDQPVGVFEKKFVAETFSGGGKLNHGLELS